MIRKRHYGAVLLIAILCVIGIGKWNDDPSSGREPRASQGTPRLVTANGAARSLAAGTAGSRPGNYSGGKLPPRTANYWRAAVRGQVKARRERERTIKRLRAQLAGAQQLSRLNTDVRYAIRYVFQDEAEHAETVSTCESGGLLSDPSGWRNASNGQYIGGFQMGDWERAAYGVGAYRTHDRDAARGASVLDQVLSAFRMWTLRGDGWLPWQCRETGGLRW